LVRADGVVQLAEQVGLDCELVAIRDVAPIQVLILQRPEEPLHDAVGLRTFHPGPHVPQQRILAGEGFGVDDAAEAGAVVGDDGHRRRRLPDQVLVGVDDVHQPEVGA
jgi:hypothetical protein